MTLHELDPIRDERWGDFVERHSSGSIFHTPQWLDALRRTYDYQPVAFTDSTPDERVHNGLLFCCVRSWMTGRRLVSLPFSDHCDPLLDSPDALPPMLDSLKGSLGGSTKYVEIRPRHQLPVAEGFVPSAEYCLHAIDLRPELGVILSRFHKNHVQRSVRKAERLGVRIDSGRSHSLLESFYRLHVLTRRRQGVPVQPASWFRHLLETLGDRLTIHIATFRGEPAAAMMTAVQKLTLVYKYGASDPASHRYGATSLLFWHAVQQAKADGLHEFDLGRSDLDNDGLMTFKDHLGGTRTRLTYYRYASNPGWHAHSSWTPRLARRAYQLVPRRVQGTIGTALYRHFG